MKKSALFLFMLVVTISVSSQNIFVTFTGNGESAVIDSVTATNSNTNQNLTLPGNETLILDLGTSVTKFQDPMKGLSIFPNPFEKTSTLTFNQLKPENVQFTIRNLVGQVLYQTNQFLVSGKHSFTMLLGNSGIYFVNITGRTDQRSIKVICTNANDGTFNIKHLGSYSSNNEIADLNLKKSYKTNYSLPFTIGDTVIFKGTSGRYTTIITDSPSASINYKISFVDCTDQADRTYEIVEIGDQLWMAENLAYLPSVSPSDDGSNSEAYYYVYDYQGDSVSAAKATDNYATYGVLYNWEAAKTACPNSWHLATDEEWKTLEKHLGMSSSDANETGQHSSGNVGRKLKSTSGWNSNGNGDNSSGFNALSGGFRTSPGGFSTLGSNAEFWSSSPNGSSDAWSRSLTFYINGVLRFYFTPILGYSVRCLKD